MYRSGNVELGASVKGWMDQFSGLLTSAGWTLSEDLFTEEAPEGSRLFAPADDTGNGFLEVFVNNSVTRLRMVKTAKRRFASRSVERDHDLANGFNYFADLSGNHVALILETPAGVSTPIVAGVAKPDALSPAWAGQGVEPPRGFTCEPVEDQVSVTHHLVATRWSLYSNIRNGLWSAVSGHNHQSAWYSLRALPGESERVPSLEPSKLGDGEAIYSPSLTIKDFRTSAGSEAHVAYIAWSSLPGVYLTNSQAGDRVAVLGDDADALYGGGGAVITADIALDATEIAFDTDALPETGVLRVEEEYLSYSQRNANTVTGLTRGLYGTEAATHALPGTLFSDDFSGDLSAYEIDAQGANVEIENAALRFSHPSFGFKYPRLYAPPEGRDGSVSVRADFSGLSANEGVMLRARYVKEGNVYAQVRSNRIDVYAFYGSSTTLATLNSADFPFALDGSHVFKLELEGEQVQLFVDNTLFAEGETDALFAGKWGVGAQIYNPNNPVILDDLDISLEQVEPLRAYLGSWWVKSGSAVISAGGEKP